MTAILSKKYAKNPRVMTFVKAMGDYFETTMAIYGKGACKKETMPPFYKPIIASS